MHKKNRPKISECPPKLKLLLNLINSVHLSGRTLEDFYKVRTRYFRHILGCKLEPPKELFDIVKKIKKGAEEIDLKVRSIGNRILLEEGDLTEFLELISVIGLIDKHEGAEIIKVANIHTFTECIKDLPPPLYEYFIEPLHGNQSQTAISINMRSLWQRYNDFYFIYQEFPLFYKSLYESPENRQLYSFDSLSHYLRIEPEFDENRKLQFRENLLIEALRGMSEGRLKVCEICGIYFWARRIESQACSDQCSNTLRQKQFRYRNKEDYNAKRRANYAHKKKLKSIRESKNGTL